MEDICHANVRYVPL